MPTPFDAYIAYARAARAQNDITSHFNTRQQVFFDFVLAHYVASGVYELDSDKLTPLLRLRYNDSIADAMADLGEVAQIREAFVGFQQYLYR